VLSKLQRLSGLALIATTLFTALPATANADTSNGTAILKSVLHKITSSGHLYLYGIGSISGLPVSFSLKGNKVASDQSFSVIGIGSEEQFRLLSDKTIYLKCSSVMALQSFCGLKSPMKSEANKWFALSPSDKRYASLSGGSGSGSLKQQFSINSQGFGPTATVVGTVTLRGQKVVKLRATSSLWSKGKGLAAGYLYVTTSAKPKLVAISPFSGTNVTMYVRQSAKISLTAPKAVGPLPS